MLKLDDVSVEYRGSRVLHSLNFELAHSELLMLVGPTGCGKTTVLKTIAGLVPPVAGEIRCADWVANRQQSIAPEKRQVGMVFQDFALFPHLSVEENIFFRLKDQSLGERWIDVLGLQGKRNSKPALLSGGQKQRAALARTLAHEPKLVLLDEPLSNLDEALKEELRWVVRDSLKKAQVPAIWVTHDQAEALSVGDRVGVMREGRLEQLGTAQSCFASPASKFVASFLGEASFVSGTVSDDEMSAITELGTVPIQSNPSKSVSVLFRPDDLRIATDGIANATLRWARYEGAFWLYGAQLDSGLKVQLRVNHEEEYLPGQRLALSAFTSEPLAAFNSSDIG
ncbi:MAG: ABC transporter ATP-binding protein [Pseudomonadota bacterium]